MVSMHVSCSAKSPYIGQLLTFRLRPRGVYPRHPPPSRISTVSQYRLRCSGGNEPGLPAPDAQNGVDNPPRPRERWAPRGAPTLPEGRHAPCCEGPLPAQMVLTSADPIFRRSRAASRRHPAGLSSRQPQALELRQSDHGQPPKQPWTAPSANSSLEWSPKQT